MGGRDDISWDDLKRMVADLIAAGQENARLIQELRESGKETDRRMQETDRRLQETDQLIRELRESGKETDRRMQETDRRMQETDQLIRELRESGKETDRRMQETYRRMQETGQLIRELRESSKETDRQMQETARQIRELKRQLGALGNRLGQFVQDMVQPAVVRLFQARGIPVHRVYPNALAKNDEGEAILEIDLLVINGDHAIAVECKSRLTSEDVDEHLDRLARFKACFTEHADKILHGAVAAMGAPEEVIRYAERQGLYVLVQADDDVVLRNRPDFEPKSW